MLMANIIEQQNRLSAKILEEKLLLDDLEKIQKLLIDAANGPLREFAVLVAREFFFDKNTFELLDKRDFVDRCKKMSKFKLTSATEIRSKFMRSIEKK